MDLGDPAASPCRRRYPRLTEPCVSGAIESRLRADLIDVGAGGVRVEAEEPVRRGLEYEVQLDSDRTLCLSAAPVWNRLVRTEGSRRASSGKPQDVPPVYAAGFKFTEELSRDRRRALGHFLRDHATCAIPKRRPPRYSIAEGTRADLVCRSRFQVRSISLSGMLLESDWFPQDAREISFSLELPRATLPLRGRVVSRRPALRSADASLVALEFTSLSHAQRRTLDQFLSERLSG